MLNKNLKRIIGTGLCLVALAGVLTACDTSGDTTGQHKESATQQSNYDRLVANQPAHTMPYSPTRNTINKWIDTWGKPGALSYIYLMTGNGQLIGYYIFKGLPVSYCASQTPTYTFQDVPGDGDDSKVQLPAPSIDGVYYSGGQCNQYYGVDASTGAYIEFSLGNNLSYLLYSQPLPFNANVKPLGQATVQNVK